MTRDHGVAIDLAIAGIAAAGLIVTLHGVFTGIGEGGRAGDAARIGSVTTASLDVRRRHDGQLVWKDLRRGAAIHDGDAVWVGSDATALVTLSDGARIDIAAQSLVVLRSPRAGEASAIVELRRGAVAVVGGEATVARGERGERREQLAAGERTTATGEKTRVAPAEAARVVPPPSIYWPTEGEEVYLPAGSRLWIGWTEAPELDTYTYELTPDGGAARRAESATPTVALERAFAEGRHCLKVRGSADWSAPRCFTVITRPRLDAPTLHDPQVEDAR